MNRKKIVYIGGGILAAVVLIWLLWPSDRLRDTIALPYIAHQPPVLDPHLPAPDPVSDKIEEILYDGLFNLSANPSGIMFEDALGTLIDSIDQNHNVTVRLNPKKWHHSYTVQAEDDALQIKESAPKTFSAKDLDYTLKRIERLGTLSPDYIMVAQALETFGFSGPDEAMLIRFKFRGDRIWRTDDIKEVLSFKIIPAGDDVSGLKYPVGTGPYLFVPRTNSAEIWFYKNPSGNAVIRNVKLIPFVDNSTFETELRHHRINVLLDNPLGALSPILEDTADFFYKSNVSTTFFGVLFNTERLNRSQRRELRRMFSQKAIVNRFYKTGTKQQKSITDYKGQMNRYADLINASVFPSTSYYVEEKIVAAEPETTGADFTKLPDTLRVRVCLNYGFREEYLELIEILNDENLFKKRLHVMAVGNDAVKTGQYDALLMAFPGYRSNFLFDLYDIFLREPDLSVKKINLITETGADGRTQISPRSLTATKNFFRMDIETNRNEGKDFATLLEYIYGFMSTREIGDKQAYAQRISDLERELSLGAWLFSMPSISYFSTQFDPKSIDVYGVASQLSTIEKWKERPGY